jgi:hypothetical protein
VSVADLIASIVGNRLGRVGEWKSPKYASS